MSERRLNIVFEGTDVSCCAGDTVAAALTAAGVLVLRESAGGDLRGLYCGMGVCQECLVTIDGRPGRLACMTTVRDGMRISRNAPRARLCDDVPSQPARRRSDVGTAEPQVLVIGGGPAGLTAASVAAELGAEVVVLDERATPGGQFFKQPRSESGRPIDVDRQFLDGRQLIERARQSGATLVSNAEVRGAFGDGELLVGEGSATRVYRAQRVIVATGAHERAVPFPGWTLPGVMTIGAAQTLLRGYGVCPGERVLVAGNGPLNAQVALELSKSGAEVVAVLELAPILGFRAAGPFFRMLGRDPGLVATGVRLLAQLRRAGVPFRARRGMAAVKAVNGALEASFGRVRDDRVDADESVTVDSVCLGYGFLPNNELLRMLGCRHRYDDERMQLVVERDPDCRTSVDDVFAIGDCCGLSGAPAAMQEGIIAASAAVESLSVTIDRSARKELRRARKRLARHRAFQAGLWDLYGAPRFSCELATPNTLLCRCENVSLQEFDATLADGLRSLPEIKRDTRLGMGACQGRYCAANAAHRLSVRAGMAPDEYSFFAPRAPLKPASIGDIVGYTTD